MENQINRMKELSGRTFGVIVDEVHSSQGGKGTKNLNQTLSLNELDVTDDVVNDEIVTLLYDKRDDFPFKIVNFPDLSGNIPRDGSMVYS